MPVRKKQRLFVLAYCDRGEKTYQNGTQSAIKAGYSEKYSHTTANLLLKREEIRKEICRIEAELNEKFSVTIEEKIKIAWEMFLEAKRSNKPLVAERWYEQHGKLSGHYTQQVDFRDKSVKTPAETEELDGIRNRVFCVKQDIASG